jgi:hypothetical protein
VQYKNREREQRAEAVGGVLEVHRGHGRVGALEHGVLTATPRWRACSRSARLATVRLAPSRVSASSSTATPTQKPSRPGGWMSGRTPSQGIHTKRTVKGVRTRRSTAAPRRLLGTTIAWRANMAEEIERFVAALNTDTILPESSDPSGR